METTAFFDPRRVTCTETAKLVRFALRRAFPSVKFSIRSNRYSGGSSIDVRWSDGPTVACVKSVTMNYAGGGFDSSIDLAYSCESWLFPDGTARPAYCAGTVASRGSVEGYNYREPVPEDAELVRFGADYVFCSRETTVDHELIARDLCELQGVPFAGIEARGLRGAGDDWSLDEHVAKLLARTVFADGSEYAGVTLSLDDPDPGAWCSIYFR
jgi:hypothetical protein